MRNGGLFKSNKIAETSKALMKDWTPGKLDYDQTVMRLEFVGIINKEYITKTYNLIDYYDMENNVSSMARTTGYTCTGAANILLSNEFNKKGVFALESLGRKPKLAKQLLSHLSKRNINITENITITN